jgi:hypothetical protein
VVHQPPRVGGRRPQQLSGQPPMPRQALRGSDQRVIATFMLPMVG